MGNWYVKVDKCPNVLSTTVNGGGEPISKFVDFRIGDVTVNLKVTPPDDFKCVELDMYTKSVKEEYKEMILAVLDMSFAEMVECFGDGYYTCLRYILEDHPDPVGAYQRWKVKKDSAKEMTIEEIEAQLGYKIKVVGKEDK